MNKMGQNVKRLRNAKGWTLKQLGDQIDRNVQAVSKMEKDDVAISLKCAIKFSEIFEVSMDDLVNGEVDAAKVVETKKIELSQYNIKTLHPTIDKDFNNLSPDLKEFGKAMTLEMYRQFAGVTIEQLKQEVSNDCINDIESMFRDNYNDNEEITIDEVIELIESLKSETA
jgi:DNA-binding XRE family transcriptional regulator